jgi:hypothetical protein
VTFISPFTNLKQISYLNFTYFEVRLPGVLPVEEMAGSVDEYTVKIDLARRGMYIKGSIQGYGIRAFSGFNATSKSLITGLTYLF